MCFETAPRFSYAFRASIFSCRVICGVRRSMKWSLCSPKWMDIGTSDAKSTQRSYNFKWDELTCALKEILNNRLQLALTSLLLDNTGSQQNCVVRHATIVSQINGTLETTLPLSRTSFGNGSDRARCFMVVQNPHKMKLAPNTCSFPQCREVVTISPLSSGDSASARMMILEV